eukprot:310136-Rhodomonas_salina.1
MNGLDPRSVAGSLRIGLPTPHTTACCKRHRVSGVNVGEERCKADCERSEGTSGSYVSFRGGCWTCRRPSQDHTHTVSAIDVIVAKAKSTTQRNETPTRNLMVLLVEPSRLVPLMVRFSSCASICTHTSTSEQHANVRVRAETRWMKNCESGSARETIAHLCCTADRGAVFIDRDQAESVRQRRMHREAAGADCDQFARNTHSKRKHTLKKCARLGCEEGGRLDRREARAGDVDGVDGLAGADVDVLQAASNPPAPHTDTTSTRRTTSTETLAGA